jgi:hypothetical protein
LRCGILFGLGLSQRQRGGRPADIEKGEGKGIKDEIQRFKVFSNEVCDTKEAKS